MFRDEVCQHVPFIFNGPRDKFTCYRIVCNIDKTGPVCFASCLCCVSATHQQFAFPVVLFVILFCKNRRQITAKSDEYFYRWSTQTSVNMVEHYAEHFYLHAISCHKGAEQRIKDKIVFCSIEQDPSIQCFDVQMMENPVTIKAVSLVTHIYLNLTVILGLYRIKTNSF